MRHNGGWIDPLCSTLRRVFLLCGLLTLPVSAVAAAEPTDELLARKLAEFPGAERGQTTTIADPIIGKLLPNYHFYALHFPVYPAAMVPRGFLGSNSVFAVRPDGSVEYLGDVDALEPFLRDSLPLVTAADQAEDTAKVWLRLVEEFYQDGFFHFSIPDDSLQALPVSQGGLRVTGRALAVQQTGPAGEIVASLVFDSTGRLASATATAKLKKGIRPICQATKLLDPDPIVRGMAEQDILVMGRDAKSYLDDVRKHASAQLRLAIDRIWERILSDR